MAKGKDKNWMEKAFANSKGQLHKKTGTKPGDKISAKKLNKAAKSKNVKTEREANLLKTVEKINSKRKKKGK